MKSTELRINNYYQGKSPEKKEWEPKYRLCAFGMCQALNNEINLKPISLTEEWVMELNCPETFLSKDTGGFFAWFNGEKIYIKYVHELQNLYFVLRGNELRPTAA